MSLLTIKNLGVAVGDEEILKGVDLEIASGEVHVVMGPNGAGKSTLSNAVMGKPGYHNTSGLIELDGREISALPTWERAQAGLFLAMQYPTEVPGVSVRETLEMALEAREQADVDVWARLKEEAEQVGLQADLLNRPLNVDMSGGEKKRNETIQLAVLQPEIAVLDELDSGLDIDALKACAERVEEMTNQGLGVLCITHYHRLLDYLPADEVHILVDGQIVESGGPELAQELEESGYARFVESEDDSQGVSVAIGGLSTGSADSAAENADPFADPLA